jgi:hypothetical protein
MLVGQIKLLHQQVARVNGAIGIEIEKFLHDNSVAVRQTGHLQRNRAVVSVADGGRRDRENGSSGQILAQQQSELKNGQVQTSLEKEGFCHRMLVV